MHTTTEHWTCDRCGCTMPGDPQLTNRKVPGLPEAAPFVLAATEGCQHTPIDLCEECWGLVIAFVDTKGLWKKRNAERLAAYEARQRASAVEARIRNQR